jgi:hypothetical protein
MSIKTLRLLPFLLLLTGTLPAAPAFPGLQALMTDAEWKRAGLDRLTPDQIGVIDAVLIRYHLQTIRAAEAATPAALDPTPAKPGLLDRFGFSKSAEADWRTQPPLVARFVMWQGANRFLLDNGQIWEGQEQIIFELPPGREVIIEARPMNSFALKLDERSAMVRVRRVK